jgi:hypothetical protein
MRDLDAPEDELAAGSQRMHIIAITYSHSRPFDHPGAQR